MFQYTFFFVLLQVFYKAEQHHSTYLAEGETYKINLFILREEVSHTRAKNPDVRYELSPAGSAAALPPLSHQ